MKKATKGVNDLWYQSRRENQAKRVSVEAGKDSDGAGMASAIKA